MANGHEEFPGQHDALYQDAAENLRFVKAQQWRVTNYALLVYAAAYLLRGNAPLDTCLGKTTLITVIVLACLFSLFVLRQLENSMARFRDRIEWVQEHHFDPADQIKLFMVPKTYPFDSAIYWGLIVVSIAGAIIVGTVVWHYAPMVSA